MKNQYFGDINDFRKYGLLRTLQTHSKLRLLVAWMLTPDDGGPDGNFRSYLDQPERWEQYDPELFEGLRSILLQTSGRGVSMLERSRLLPRTTFFSKSVPDDEAGRTSWFAELLGLAAHSDLVFLDPDNGIEVPSVPVGRKNSSKYLAWSELRALWRAGCSLMIYQHFPRRERIPFMRRLVSQFADLGDSAFAEAFRTKHVVFLLVSQRHHESQLRSAMERVGDCWAEEIAVVGFSNSQ